MTTVIPARRMPKRATGYWSRFGSMTAIRSPLDAPRSPWRKAAKRRDIRSTAEKLIDLPRLWNAGRSPYFSAIRSRRSGMEE